MEQEAFDEIRQMVATYVLLAYPDFDKCFDINTGASKYKLGAVIRK